MPCCDITVGCAPVPCHAVKEIARETVPCRASSFLPHIGKENETTETIETTNNDFFKSNNLDIDLMMVARIVSGFLDAFVLIKSVLLFISTLNRTFHKKPGKRSSKIIS